MNAVSIPRCHVFRSEDAVIVDYEDGQQHFRATFTVSPDEEADQDGAVFAALDRVDASRQEIEDATIEDIPRGVLVVLQQWYSLYRSTDDRQRERDGRGVA